MRDSKSRAERQIRKALAMLRRAKSGCELPGAGPLADEGPVAPAFARGWAMACLELALRELSGQEPVGSQKAAEVSQPGAALPARPIVK